MFRINAYTWFGLAMVVVTLGQEVAAAPTWLVQTWQSDAGLPDNTVVGIDQTPDDFLWVATKTGLVRFDGVEFRQFPVAAEGLPASANYSMCADRRGRLWIAKERGGVVCVDPKNGTTAMTLKDGLPDDKVHVMVADAEGAVWVTYTRDKVVRIQDGRVRSFTAEEGLAGTGGSEMTVDGTGRLWFYRVDWAGVFRDGRFWPLQQMLSERIAGARSGGLWTCNGKQLFRYAEGGPVGQAGVLPEAGANKGPTVLCEDRDNRLWIGTREAGLFTFGHEGFTAVPTRPRTILSIKEDREGSLWVGSRGGGLIQLRKRLAELLTTDATAQSDAVLSVCQDTDRLLWAVIWQKGVVLRGTGSNWTQLSAKDGWAVENAQCVAADPQGGVWIGTQYLGLYRWREGVVTEILVKTNGLSSRRVNALLATPSGELWIGGGFQEEEQHTLQCLKDGRFRTFPLPAGSGPVITLATDNAGDCWAATSKGWLLRVSKDVLANETGSTLAGTAVIRSLCATPDGSLWIGYAGQGLGRLKDGRFSHFRMAQGLHDDFISNMLPDARGRLWFAGNRGIFSVRLKELDDCGEGRITKVRSVSYRQKDGLPGLQASYDAGPGALRDADGRLLFAMQSGIAAVYADDIQENPAPPSVVVTRVIVNGKEVAAYGAAGYPAEASAARPLELGQGSVHLRLEPGQRQVEFCYTALSFAKPENVGFKYRLQGLDADWVEAGTRRSATYSHLQPGHYQFSVTACNSDGLWNMTGASLEMTVEPYWWETAWFRVAGPLCIAGLLGGWIFLGLRRRHRRQLERLEMQQVTERERTRIARDMHDDLGSHLTRIVMLSDSDPDNHECAPASGRALTEINQTGREMTLKMSEIVWALNPQHDTLDSFAGYVAKWAHELLATAKINCRLDLPLDLPASPLSSPVRHDVLLAFKESLHNIVKHAHATSVLITLKLEGTSFVLTVKDDGKGFAVPPDASLQGHGLANMKHRLTEAGGLCEVLSQPGKGTCIRFTVPLSAKR